MKVDLTKVAVEAALAGGATNVTVERGGKHYKVKFTAPNGKLLMVVVSGTPSSQNAPKQVAADVKRTLARAA